MSNRIAGIFALLLGLLIMAGSLSRGHVAHSTTLPVLTLKPAGEVSLSPLRAADLLLRHGEKTIVLDLRSEPEFMLYHLPDSARIDGLADPGLPEIIADKGFILLVAATDQEAATSIAEGQSRFPDQRWLHLQGGARAWYLAFELPVGLFNDKPLPAGYEAALATVRTHLLTSAAGDSTVALSALAELARLNVTPDALGSGKARSTAGANKKKIGGGCE